MARANLEIKINADTRRAIRDIKELDKALKSLAKNRAFDLKVNSRDVLTAQGRVEKLDKQIDKLDKDVKLDADSTGIARAARSAKAAVDGVPARKTTKLDADALAALKSVKNARVAIDSVPGETRTRLKVDESGALKAVKNAKVAIDSIPELTKARIDADSTELIRKLAHAEKQLKALENQEASPQVDLDIAAAEAKLRLLNKQLDNLQRQSIKITGDVSDVVKKAGIARAALLSVPQRVNTKIDADTTAALSAIRNVKVAIDAVPGQTRINIDADITQLQQKLVTALRELDALTKKKSSPQVDLDILAAQANIKKIDAELNALGRKRVTATVNVDVDRGLAGLRGLTAAAGGVQGALGGLTSAAGTLAGAVFSAGSTGASAMSNLGSAAGGASGGFFAVTRAAGGVLAIVGVLQQTVGAVVGIAVTGFQAVGIAITVAAVAATALTAAVAALGVVAAGAFGLFGAAMLAVGALITLVVARAVSGSKDIQESFKKLNKAINDDIVEISKAYVKVFDKFLKAVQAALPQLTKPLKEAFATIAGVADRSIKPLIATLQILSNAFRDLTTTLAPAFEQFLGNLPALTSSVTKALQTMADAFALVTKQAGQASLDALGRFIVKMGELGATLIRIGGQNFQFIMDRFTEMVGHIQTMATQLEPAIQPAIQAFTDLFGAITSAIGESGPKIATFAAAVSTHMGGIKSVIKSVIGIATSLGESFLIAVDIAAPSLERLAQTAESEKEVIGQAFGDLLTILAEVGRGFLILVKECAPSIRELAQVVTENKGVIEGAFRLIGASVSGLVGLIKDVINIMGIWQGTLDGLLATIEGLGSVMSKLPIPGFEALGKGIEATAAAARALHKATPPATTALEGAGNAAQTATPKLDGLNSAATPLPPTFGLTADEAAKLQKELGTGLPAGAAASSKALPGVGTAAQGIVDPLGAAGAAGLTAGRDLANAFDVSLTKVQGQAELLRSSLTTLADYLNGPFAQTITNTKAATLGLGTGIAIEITALNTPLAAFGAALTTLNPLLVPFATGMTGLGTALLTANPQLLALKDNLLLLNPALTGLGTALTTLNPLLAPFAQHVTALGTGLLTLNPQLVVFKDTLLLLNPALTALGTTLTTLNPLLLTFGANMKLMGESLLTANPQIVLLKDTLLLLNPALVVLSTTLTTLNPLLLTFGTNMKLMGEALLIANPQLISFKDTLLILNPQLLALTTSLQGLNPQLVAFAANLQAVTEKITGLIAKLGEFITKMNETVAAADQFAIGVRDAFFAAADGAFDGLSALLSYVAQTVRILIQYIPIFGDLGYAFGISIAQGMLDAGPAVSQAGFILGQMAAQGFMAALGIGSPSKVGIDGGQNFGESIGMGMDKAMGTVAKSAGNLGRTAMFAAQDELIPSMGGVANFNASSDDFGQEQGDTIVQVFIDGKEFKGMVKTEIATHDKQLRRALAVN